MKKKAKKSSKLPETEVILAMNKNEAYWLLNLIETNEISLLKNVKDQIQRQLDEG